MLTAALGFAAIETTLFLTEPLAKGQLLNGLIASNFRSIGPMLIHLVSSAILGLFIGLAFYKSKLVKFLYLIVGLLTAIILHSIFNFFIVLNDTTHNMSFFWLATLGTWIFVVIILAFFEKVKRVVRKI
jgi:RsiW-degrading membrane proteinase PrsW (M82 family)